MLHAARKHSSHLWVSGANTQVQLLRLTSLSLAKRCSCTTAVATSKDRGFSAASAAKPKPAFWLRWGHTLAHHMRSHISGDMRDDVKTVQFRFIQVSKERYSCRCCLVKQRPMHNKCMGLYGNLAA